MNENHCGSDPLLIALQGRITALELFNRIVLTALANGGRSHPVAALDQMQADMLSTMQMLERPADDYSDAVWGETGDAIKLAFQSARLRLVDQHGES